MQKLEVIIPAFNEAETVGKVINGIREVLGDSCRVIVVDDGSTDATAQVAEAGGAEVVRHPYHIGNGASVKTGLRRARAEIVLLMDGDGQHPVEQIPSLLSHIAEYDMVVGARDFSGFSLRALANRFYNLFAGYVAQFDIRDLTSGFRLVKRDVAMRFLYLLPNGFSYPTTLTLAFLKTGRTVKYMSVPFGFRGGGRSKIKLFPDGIKFLLIITRIATFFSPLRVFLPVSLFFLLSGFLYYLYTYITSRRFTNMAVLLLVTSVLVFMLSLVSEQIAQLRMDKTEEHS